MDTKTFILGLGCILVVSSCTKSDSIYDPNYNSDMGITIPDGFTWSTTKTVKATINVGDEYNGKYHYLVSIYSSIPTTSLKPLATGKANVKEPFIQEITIPASSSKLYVTLSLPDAGGSEELITTKEVSVNELNNLTLTRTAVTRGNNKKGNTLNYYSDLAGSDNWTEITTTDGSDFKLGNGNYVIKKDAYFTINAQSMNGGIIYVKPGVHVKIAQKNSGNQVSVGTNSKLYNDGCIEVVGEGATFSVKNGGGFYNNGSLITPNVDFKSNSGDVILCKNCFISTETLDIAGGSIIMETGSWINAKTIVMSQGQSGSITLSDDATNISEKNYAALITTQGITVNNKGLTLAGNNSAKLLVECPTTLVTLGNNAEYTSDATGLITIAASACCDGFGSNTVDYAGITYAMEDQFPEKGDFDLNDVVIKLNPSVETKTNTSGTTTSVSVSGKLLAVGGTVKCAGYVELYGDNGTKIATQQLFSDAHEKMGVSGLGFVNTVQGAPSVTPADVNATFSNVEGITTFDPAKNMKFYISVKGGSPIYTAEDGGISTTNSQVIGGIRVLDYEFHYPLETVDITKAYNESGHEISKWIESNTVDNTDWYKYPTSGKVF